MSEEELKALLGDDYKVESRTVDGALWNNDAKRAEFLCQRVKMLRYHVHDEPQPDGSRLVWFAVDSL